jgi:hypothetical protein
MWGNNNQANEYRNSNISTRAFVTNKPVTIKDFNESMDRISLQNQASSLVLSYNFNYYLSGNTIKLNMCATTISPNPVTVCENNKDSVRVEGIRANLFSDPSALNDSFGLVVYR